MGCPSYVLGCLLAAVAAAAAAPNSSANFSVVVENGPSNGSSVFCKDNSTACQTQKRDLQMRKVQVREAARGNAGAGIEPDSKETTFGREMVLTLGTSMEWVRGHEKAFKAAVVSDISAALRLEDNSSVSIAGVFDSTGGNGTKVVLTVRGEDALMAMDNISSPEQAKAMHFPSLANATGNRQDVRPVRNLTMTNPKSVLTSAALRHNVKQFKKRAALRPGADKMPLTKGLDTPVQVVLERAAKREENDAARDVSDGNTRQERRVEAVTEEILALVGSELTKSLRRTDSKVPDTVKQLTNKRDPSAAMAKSRMSVLGKELGSMLALEL